MKTALLFGVTGQDGSYLAELLLEKGYEVHGVIRRSSSLNTHRIDHIFDRLYLHYGDLTDGSFMTRLFSENLFDEIYQLGAQSHVKTSFDIPVYTSDVNALGTLRLLDAIRNLCPESKFYQASSSEMFGQVLETPQTESTPFNPQSPYATAKTFAYYTTKNYREAYGIFACNGILFNHESPRRGETFVTKKITKAIGRIVRGEQKELLLGNLDAQRDWGYAPEYVEGIYRMMQQPKADDFILATGETHQVKEFLDISFQYVNLDWKDYVRIDERYFRPTEVDLLLGDARKAKDILNWEPKIKFKELVKIMVEAELK